MKKVKLILSIILCCTLAFSANTYGNVIKQDADCIHYHTNTTYSTSYDQKKYEGHRRIEKKTVYCEDCNAIIEKDTLVKIEFETHQASNYHSGTKHYLIASCKCEYKYSYACSGPPCIIPYSYLNIILE